MKLNTSKVLAGGMAAATSAVFGSYFGVFGTVGGAAVGSVVTTVGTSLYQHSLERTRERVRSRLPAASGTIPRPRLPRGRSLRFLLGGTLLIFAVGLVLVTGFEWAKGAPLSGGNGGTSLGKVFTPTPHPVAPATPEPDPAPSTSDDHASGEPGATRRPERPGLEPGGLLPSEGARPLPSAPPAQPPLLPRLGRSDSEGGELLPDRSSDD